MPSRRTVSLIADEHWEGKVWQLLEAQYGIPRLAGYRLLRSGKKRIRILSEDLYALHSQVPCVGPVGLYLGEDTTHAIRLSMDGAQFLGPYAKNQVVTISAAQASTWIQGHTLTFDDERRGYVIVKHKDAILGCGSLSSGRLRSFVPKVRRLTKGSNQ